MKRYSIFFLFAVSCICCIAQEDSVFTRTGVMKGHDYVDLGLPSGTMWATCNIGAQKATENGDYYAWGEIKSKKKYSEDTYKYVKFNKTYQFTKYCNHSKYGYKGFYDKKVELDRKDDVAYRKWKGEWRIPTYMQISEILLECFIVETSDYNGTNVPGIIIYKAKNRKDKGHRFKPERDKWKDIAKKYTLKDTHIFLPSAGYIKGEVQKNSDDGGYYMSSRKSRYDEEDLIYLRTHSRRISRYDVSNFRFIGMSVRPVFVKQNLEVANK